VLQGILPCTGCGSSCGILTAPNGTFSDGSGSSNYADMARCQWIIAPTNATQITLTFTEFSTQSYADYVRIFQCVNTDCVGSQRVLIAELHGQLSSGYSPVFGPGFLLVQFTSDSITTSSGFTASWSSNALTAAFPNVSYLS
jgi:hypothetical protein